MTSALWWAEEADQHRSGAGVGSFVIARVLVSDPSLIVCDEPASALDVSLQADIINLLRDLQDEFGLAHLFITHDITLSPYLADEVAVQYLGVLAELGPARDVLTAPRHP